MNERNMMSLSKKLFLAITVILVTAPPVLADNGIESLRQTSKAFTEVANKAVPAVVSVRVEKVIQVSSGYPNSPFGYHSPFDDEFFERFFGRRYRGQAPKEHRQMGQGSGFIISDDGYVLTNNHVVEDADNIIITLNDGREFKDVKVIGADPGSDVAVLKIDSKDLPFIELGDSDKLEIGEWVMAVGNPFGLSETVTVGVVSAKGRKNLRLTDDGYEDFIQTDAAINPGNSGGPLLNLDGQVIGINSAIYSKSGGYMGVGFAIPINMATTVKDQLIKNGKVTRGFLGVSMQNITSEMSEYFELSDKKGVLINEVIEDSPAEKGGLKVRDIITKLNGNPVEGPSAFKNSIALIEPGTKVTLTIIRDQEEMELKIEIGSRDDELAKGTGSEVSKKLGIEVIDITKDLRKQLDLEGFDGVVISKVLDSTPADKAGIEPGMVILEVNGKKISNVEEFDEALKPSEKTKKVLMLIKHEYFAQYIPLRID
ncbi:MAG: DegQ family serine endoprotease [Sedimentisphaerales bacterium]|nr:DegQ family serine endoprotease [Sedimentisphaerales bacterium]